MGFSGVIIMHQLHVIFLGNFRGWNLSQYWAEWGKELEKEAICAHDDKCYHEDFIRGPFYIFSVADFSFHTF
jgi:hypothetical protein